ncbi:MAG: ATP-binding protein [Xanthobacteraceae bacterium]
MRRGSRAGGKPIKARPPKPVTLKRRNVAKAGRPSGSSAAGQEAEVARLTRERDEAVEQQTAAFKVLEIINSSAGDLHPVFAAMLENAVRICDAKFGSIYRWDDDALSLVATHNTPPALVAVRRRVFLNPKLPFGRMAAIKTAVQVADLAAEEAYFDQRDPTMVAAVELGGVRTLLAVPMLKENELIGVISVFRQEVRPFTSRQIALLTSFAHQAAVAIENTRLLSELRLRTAELGRSVEELHREQNNKLMTLEAMAASIGHEVRQPLAAIVSNGGAALRFLAHTPLNLEEARLALNRIVSDSHRVGQVFDNIRALFGRADRAQEPIDVKELALSVLQALREQLKDHSITTHIELTSELPPVMGHRGQLQEVFINLVHNAIEAMDAVKDDNRLLRVRTDHHDGKAIIVTVEDSGPGIDSKKLDSIFDAFVTTKPHGMGLGLALCRMIIERHEGQLSALPAHPRGSVFRVVLPAARPGVA